MTYKTYKKKRKEDTTDLDLLKAKLEMRHHIFQKIKKIYDADLALLEEAEKEYKTYVGETKEKKKNKTAK